MSAPVPEDLSRTRQAPVPPLPASEAPTPSPVEAGGTKAQTSPSPAALAAAAGLVHFPGYEILGELGRGGMGIVYKARHLGLKRIVAVKILRSALHPEADELARFRVEAESIARLQHPGVVQVFDISEHNGCSFLVLEFVAGGSLAARLKRGTYDPRLAAVLAAKLARTMAAVHERGILHRDLKPANILLAGDDEPKITDFGLAKQLDAGPSATASGAVIGTPCYMAPEQAEGKRNSVGPATDVYALGGVLYEILTGMPPFQGDSTLETLRLVISREVSPPSRHRPRLPSDLEQICLKCLRKDPPDRYATARELADDLDRFLSGAPVKARRGAFSYFLRRRLRHPVILFLTCLGLVGMFVSFMFLCSANMMDITAGAAGFVAGALLTGCGVFSLAILSRTENALRSRVSRG